MASESEKIDRLENRVAEALASLGEGCAFNVTELLFPGLIEDSEAFRSAMNEVLTTLKEMEKKDLVESAGDFAGVEFFRLKEKGKAPRPKRKRSAENIEERVLDVLKTREASASDIAAKIFPFAEDLRARTSQVYVSLKRLEKKGLVIKGAKKGKKQLYKLAKEETRSSEILEDAQAEEVPEPIVIKVPESRKLSSLFNPKVLVAGIIVLALALLPAVLHSSGITGFFLAHDALQVSLQTAQLGEETELTYAVRNVRSEPVTGVKAELILPEGSKIINNGGALIEEIPEGYKLSWNIPSISGGGVEKFAVRAVVNGEVSMRATGSQHRRITDSLAQPIEANLGPDQYGYSQIVAEPKGYLTEILVSVTGSEIIQEQPVESAAENATNLTEVPVAPIENVSENATENVTIEENVTEENVTQENVTTEQNLTAEENVTEHFENVTQENITVEENTTETGNISEAPQPEENVTEQTTEEVAQEVQEEGSIVEENITEPAGPTGAAIGETGTIVKIYLDPDNEWNGNEDLVGEQNIIGEWSGSFRANLPEGKYNKSMNLVVWSSKGVHIKIDAAHLVWSQDVKVEAKGVARIEAVMSNETNVSFEKIEEDPTYDAIIDEARLSSDGTLVVVFHHNADRPMPIAIEGDIDYLLSTNFSEPYENVTLKVFNWTEEDYFEIYIGTATEVLSFGTPKYYKFQASVKNAKGENVEAKIEFLKQRTGKKAAESAGLAHAMSVKGGRYKIKVTLARGPVKEVVLNNVKINSSITEFINIDDTPEVKGFVEIYAIDPTSIEFESANVTVTAKGRILYKCKDWDFTNRACQGNWTKLMDISPGQNYTFSLTMHDPGFAEVSIAECAAEDIGIKGSFGRACDSISGDSLIADDSNLETHTWARGKGITRWGGVRINSSNTSITNCDSITKVELCYKWWNQQLLGNSPNSCDISVDADGGASYTAVTTTCPGTSEPSSMTCVDVTSLENWDCGTFFGPSATGALAKSELSRTSGIGYHGGRGVWDVLFFNVSYTEIDTSPPGSVTGLVNQSAGTSWIYWTWTNPTDEDFNETIVFIDGINVINTSNNYYNASGLERGSVHTITLHTKDNAGNINNTDINNTAQTVAGFLIVNLPFGKRAVLAENTSVDVTTVPQIGIKDIYLAHGVFGNTGNVTAMLTINFSSDIDLSGIVVETNRGSKKAVLHILNSPANIVQKHLLIPSTGVGEVYICPGVNSLATVGSLCANKVTMGVGQTKDGMSVSTAVIDSEDYYLVSNIAGTGGGEGSPPVVSNVVLSSTSGNNLTSDNLTVAYDVSDADGDAVKNITNWYRDGASITSLNMPFEGGSNSSYTKDYSGHVNDGFVNNSVWKSNISYDGFGAYEFASGYIRVEDDSSLDLPEEMTILAWIKPDVVTSARFIVEKGYNDNDNFGFLTYGDELYFEYNSTSGYQYKQTTTANLAAGNWYHDCGEFELFEVL